ncbi:MAG: lipopolysaccharide assembly protein LapA domain-containing protein [Devosia sp.]
MMRRIVGWVVLVPLCLVLIVFALANRQLVVVNFNPFVPSEALTTPGVGVPLFLVLFGVLLFGVVLGGVATWFAQSQHRRDERTWRRETERLTREVDNIRRSPSVLPTVDDLAKS